MSNRQNLLNQISAFKFAAFELALFLDTHPDERAAIALHCKYMDQALALERQYERQYGPLFSQDIPGNAQSWTWIDSPWPWEYVEV